MHVQGKGSPAADRQNEEFSVTPKACSLKWGSTAGIQAHLKVLFDASASDPSHTLNAGEVVTLGGATCTGAGGGGGGCCCTMGRGEGGRALGEGIADAWLGAGIEEGTVMGGTAVATPPFFLFFFRDFFASSSAACSHRQPGQRTGIASHQRVSQTVSSYEHLWWQVLSLLTSLLFSSSSSCCLRRSRSAFSRSCFCLRSSSSRSTRSRASCFAASSFKYTNTQPTGLQTSHDKVDEPLCDSPFSEAKSTRVRCVLWWTGLCYTDLLRLQARSPVSLLLGVPCLLECGHSLCQGTLDRLQLLAPLAVSGHNTTERASESLICMASTGLTDLWYQSSPIECSPAASVPLLSVGLLAAPVGRLSSQQPLHQF